MMDEATQIWLAFHSVPEQEQREWLQSILQAIRDQDRQIEFYKHAWQTLAKTQKHAEPISRPGRLI
tara:strand:+ start:4761 stop:4958 length:198 start_codon:yes stop_codon:yes gene_type:complete